MSQPKQHHYLPKNALLRFFESKEKSGFLWMYQRGKDPVFVDKNNLAKEKHLYSFANEDGSYNTELETAFGEMESVVSPILEKLNNATSQIKVKAQEKEELAYFLAMQATRTPAFRDLLKKQSAEMAKLHMKILASNKYALKNSLEEIKKDNPDIPDISMEKMQEFILGDEYDVEMGNENYFLKQAVQLGDHIYPIILMKDFFILKSKSIEFVTCDYPVVLISDPSVPPFYSGGFLMSGILVPIGTNTALFCKNPDIPREPSGPEEVATIGYKDVPDDCVEWANGLAINYAERFLFSTSLNQIIREGFDKTTPPKRFYVSSPF